MQCPSCGTSLPVGSTFCPHCGKPISVNAEHQHNYEEEHGSVPYIDFGPFSETAFSPSGAASPSTTGQPSQSPQPQQQAVISSGARNDLAAQGIQQQQPQHTYMPVPGQAFPDAGPQFQHPSGTYMPGQSYPNMETPPQWQQWQQQQPGMFPPPQPVAMPPQQPRRARFSPVILSLLVVLVLILIGGGFLIYYGAVLRPNTLKAQATAIARNQPTTQAKTPTAQPTTPITATNPQDLYTQVIGRTPTLNDPLTAQDSNSWKDLETQNDCNFSGGALHLTTTSTQPEDGCYAGNTSFTNFAYQVNMTIAQGNVGGLLFHMDLINRKILFFAIGTNGLYELDSINGSSNNLGNVKILTGGTSAAIVTGSNQQNTLAVIMQGSTISLYINKQFVTSVTDSSTASGSIGMICGNTGSGSAAATFSNAQVWTL